MTYGENLVDSLLSELQKTKKYYAYREPRITRVKSSRKNPDFVVVGAAIGVIILEVKDWVHISEATHKQVKIQRRDQSVSMETNPILIAEDYAHNLSSRFQELDELMRLRHGRKVLKFPWMAAVVFPNINRKTIRYFVENDVWDKDVIIGQEDLASAEKLEKALLNIPRLFPLDKPLSMNVLDVIRGVLDPVVIFPDQIGQPAGITTIQQTSLIKESLKPKPESKQKSLFPDEFLSDDTVEVAQDSSVRLVRGVAGSGKSLVLARRAQFLAEKYPELNILVLAFNVDLVHDLERRIPGAANLKVINFHKVCSQILGKEWRDPLNTEGWLKNKFSDFLAKNDLSAEFVADEIEWRKELGLYDSAEYLNAKREGRETRLVQSKREIVNIVFDQYVELY